MELSASAGGSPACIQDYRSAALQAPPTVAPKSPGSDSPYRVLDAGTLADLLGTRPKTGGSVPLLMVGAIVGTGLDKPHEVCRSLDRYLDIAHPGDRIPSVLLWAFPGGRDEDENSLASVDSVSAFSELSGAQPCSDGEPLLPPEQLTESETRVLRYLATSLSAPEIARELCVSINTVKTHLRHLYTKLGVHRRQEAVNRAKGLRLLGSRAAS
jgi:LuxR family maltose regulon positive regulatory protein